MIKMLKGLAAVTILALVVTVQPLEAQPLAAQSGAGSGLPSAPPSGAGGGFGGAAQGFNSQTLVFELSLFLPQDALGRAFGAGGRGAYGNSGKGGARPEAGGAGGTTGGGGAAGGGAQVSRDRPARFVRNPRLFLTKAQVDSLLPVLVELRNNAMPSPSKARRIEAEIDTILTKAQKSEYADWRKAMESYLRELRQRFAASGGPGASGGQGASTEGGALPGPGGGAPGGPGPEGPGAGGTQPGASGGLAGGRAGASGSMGPSSQAMNQLQRRQKLLDSFIAALEDYRKGL